MEKNQNRASQICGTTSKDLVCLELEFKKKRRKNDVEKIFEEKMVRTSPNLVKDIRLKIQEFQRTPCKISKKKPCLGASYPKFYKAENILKAARASQHMWAAHQTV